MTKQFWAFSLLACLMIGALACPAKSPTSGGGNPTATPVPPTGTPTQTSSPTQTGTPTSSPTPCTPAYATSYTFPTDAQCWGFDGVPITIITAGPVTTVYNLGESVGWSSLDESADGGSWMGIVNNPTGAATVAEEVHITFPCASSPVFAQGTTVLAFVRCSAANAVDAQLFVNYGPNNTSCTTQYENPNYCSGGACSQTGNYSYHISSTGWSAVTLITGFTGGVSQNVGKIGINFLNLPTGSVTLYVDEVSITAPSGLPTATATATATAQSGFFEGSNYATTGWGVIIGGTTSPTTFTGIQLYAPGGSSVSAAGVSVGFSTTNQGCGFQYVYGASTDWTSLGITGLRFYANANPVPSDNTGIQPFVQSGPSYAYESSYNNYSTTGWVQLSYAPPFTASGSSPVSVDQFGINFATGGTSTTWAANDLIEISDVELY